MMVKELIARLCGCVVSAPKQAHKFLFLIVCLIKCKYAAALFQDWMTFRQTEIWIVWVILRKQLTCTLQALWENLQSSVMVVCSFGSLGVIIPVSELYFGDFHIGYWKDNSTLLISHCMFCKHWPTCEYLPAVCQFHRRASWGAWEM